MQSRQIHIVSVLLWALTVTCITTVVGAQPLIGHVPADAVAYVGWAGADAMGPRYEQSKLKVIMEHPPLRRLLEKAMAEGRAGGRAAVNQDEEAAALGEQMLDHLWRRPWAGFVTDQLFVGPQGKTMPRGGLIMDMGDADQAAVLLDLINRIEAAAPPDAEAPPSRAFTDGNLVVMLLDDAEGELALGQGDEAARLAFDGAMAHVRPDAAVVVFADVPRCLKLIEKGMAAQGQGLLDDRWTKLRPVLGLDGIRRVVFGAGFVERDWATTLHIEAPAPRRAGGLLSLLEAEPIGDDALRIVPKLATWLSVSRLDVGRALDLMRSAAVALGPDAVLAFEADVLGAASAALDMDVEGALRGLGDLWVMYADPSQAGFMNMGFCAINSLADAERVELALDRLETWANQMLTEHGEELGLHVRITRVQQGGLTIRSLAWPMVSPSWCVADGRLIVALSPQGIGTAAIYARGGQPSILDQEKFTATRRLLGDGPFVSLGYADLPQTAGTMFQLQAMALGILPQLPIEDNPLAAIPPPALVMPLLSPAMHVGRIDDTGYTFQTLSPFPYAGFLSPHASLSWVTATPLMAAMLTPALLQAREAAQATVSVSNLRQISVGIAAYAMDHKQRFPPDMATLVTNHYLMTPKVFAHPSGVQPPDALNDAPAAERAGWVAAHASYVYVAAGLDMDKVKQPGRHVTVFEHPRFATDEGVATGFVDGHVERIPPDLLDLRLQQQTNRTLDEWLAKQPRPGPPPVP
jgi:hypothetical protein